MALYGCSCQRIFLNLSLSDPLLFCRLWGNGASKSASETNPIYESSHCLCSLHDLMPALGLIVELLFDESGPPAGALQSAGCADEELKQASQCVSDLPAFHPLHFLSFPFMHAVIIPQNQAWLEARTDWIQDHDRSIPGEGSHSLGITSTARVTSTILPDLAALVCRLWIETPVGSGESKPGVDESDQQSPSLGTFLRRWRPRSVTPESIGGGGDCVSDDSDNMAVLSDFLTHHWEKSPLHFKRPPNG